MAPRPSVGTVGKRKQSPTLAGNRTMVVQPLALCYMKLAVDLLLLFTAIGFAPSGSSPTIVQTETMKQHYTLITTQYNKTYKSNHTTTHSVCKYLHSMST
jgi:hypothetical protein